VLRERFYVIKIYAMCFTESYAEVRVSRNGPERRSGKIIIASTAFRLEFQMC